MLLLKLENLIGHITSKKNGAQAATRTKVLEIPSLSIIMVILTEMFCVLPYLLPFTERSLCAYCKIISAQKKSQENLCLMLVHYVRCCILHRLDFEYCFIVQNTLLTIYDSKKNWKLLLGPVMSDKNKRSQFRSFFSLFLVLLRVFVGEALVEMSQQCRCLVCLCLLLFYVLILVVVVSDIFNDRLNSHIAFKLCFSFHITRRSGPAIAFRGCCCCFCYCWRFTTKRIQFWTILAFQINYNKAKAKQKVVVFGQNLLLSQRIFIGTGSKEVREICTRTFFRFNSSVNFVERFFSLSLSLSLSLLALAWFLLSFRPESIHLGSEEIGEEMVKGSRNMQHKL